MSCGASEFVCDLAGIKSQPIQGRERFLRSGLTGPHIRHSILKITPYTESRHVTSRAMLGRMDETTLNDTALAGADSHWIECAADEWSDALVASMKLGGIDHLFFVSGFELAFLPEAVVKAQTLGRPAPRL